ncbi:alanyl-tRNA synthetase [Capsaspora owczarzaki ATCC 30864]|uniref:alanyl-tRNA synthetase n=1 Tax=Capsaspora owczarzaki (strain ATCC 30864) TaxID=595528 RepID=UPI00035230A3|nr:alanyl-tRNA synthetase [Capsaspora owczarzaki ATCC 30864]|eukprot:XP_004347898.2 alanyl-tRNA synthetase [Capsaspora owczarzaki ATCC 30864]
MTSRKYFTDTLLFVANARVVSLSRRAPAASTTQAAASAASSSSPGLDLVLDETIMHPQGGGQPSDVGFIQWDAQPERRFTVVDVRADKGAAAVVHHYGSFGSQDLDDAALATASAGAPVTIHVDESKRRLHARLHSAGHLLDSAVRNLGHTGLVPSKGYHFPDGPNVEYLGELEQTVRDGLPAALNIELQRLIATGGDVQVKYVPTSTLEGGGSGHSLAAPSAVPAQETSEPLRYDSPDAVRMVNIGGVECPCGGTHVKSIGDLQNVKVTKVKRAKGTLKVYYEVSPM